MRSRIVLALAVLATAALVANAGVFVYYPAEVYAFPQKPVVYFAAGTNAGNNDLNGTTIDVTVGTNGTVASIAVHPTLGYTYYHDILQVQVDANAQGTIYVNFYVAQTNYTQAGFAEVYLVINGQKYFLAQGNYALATPLTLNPGDTLSIGLLFYAPDDTVFQDNDNNGRFDPAYIQLTLVYSPNNEAFQPLP